MKDKQQTITGNSIGAIGDNINIRSTNYNFPSKPRITRSLLKKICIKIVDVNEQEDVYDISTMPMEITEKIEYNKLQIYKEIFERIFLEAYKLEEIFQSDFRLGEKIVNQIASCYIKTHKLNHAYKNNDERILGLSKELYEKVCSDTTESDYELCIEEVEFGIDLIIYYVFTKCQILEKVTK